MNFQPQTPGKPGAKTFLQAPVAIAGAIASTVWTGLENGVERFTNRGLVTRDNQAPEPSPGKNGFVEVAVLAHDLASGVVGEIRHLPGDIRAGVEKFGRRGVHTRDNPNPEPSPGKNVAVEVATLALDLGESVRDRSQGRRPGAAQL